MQIILYLSMTANGMIAADDDDTSWVSPEAWQSYLEKCEQIGCVLVGRRTYDQMGEDEFIQNCLYIILTHNRQTEVYQDNCIVAHSPEEAIAAAKEHGHDELLISGGSEIASAFLKEGYLSEIFLDIEPFILTHGIPLFSGKDLQKRLILLGVKQLGEQIIQLHYRVQ